MRDLDYDELQKRLELSERRRSFLKKKMMKNQPEEDGFGWSLADLMTLLLIFFILFYSYAVTREGTRPEEKRAEPSRVRITTLFTWPSPEASKGKADKPAEKKSKGLQELKAEVMKLEEARSGTLSVRMNPEGLVLSLNENITFPEGEARLLRESWDTLHNIAAVIRAKSDFGVVISGHTDDKPINTAQFPSNLELSAARAVTVARLLIDNGVDPERVSVRGYSAFQPLKPNDTSENRQANRRVEILLVEKRG